MAIASGAVIGRALGFVFAARRLVVLFGGERRLRGGACGGFVFLGTLRRIGKSNAMQELVSLKQSTHGQGERQCRWVL